MFHKYVLMFYISQIIFIFHQNFWLWYGHFINFQVSDDMIIAKFYNSSDYKIKSIQDLIYMF